MPHHLSLVVAAPAAGALLLLALPTARPGFLRAVTIGATALTFALAVPLWFWFEPRGPQWQFADQFSVLAAGGSRYSVAVDGFALTLVIVTALVALAAALATSLSPLARGRAGGIALLLLETGVLGVFVSLDLVLTFLFWQSAVAALLAMTWLSQPRRVFALSCAAALAGAVAMLAGVSMLHAHYQSLAPMSNSVSSFDLRAYVTLSLPAPLETRVFLLFAAAFASPVVLLLLQSASLHRGAAPLLVLLTSAIAVKVGVFGFIRLLQPVAPSASRTFAAVLTISCLAAALAAALAALRRTDFRTSVFWLGVCHLLLAAAGTFAATPEALTGGMVHLAAHSLAVAALLVFGGIVVSDTAERSSFDASRYAPVALLMAGVVVAGGLTGSRMILTGLASLGLAARGAAAAAIAVSVIALVTSVRRALSGSTQPVAIGIDAGAMAAVAPLAVLSVLIAAYPAPLLARLETSVARVVMRVSPQYAPQVADCLNQPVPPPPPDSGLPAGMMLAAPCTDGSKTPVDPEKK